MMRFIFALILSLIDLLGFGGISVLVGFWWWLEAHANLDASLFRATVWLFFFFVMYYKLFFQPRNFRSPYRFYFYSALWVSAIIGYLYVVFFKLL